MFFHIYIASFFFALIVTIIGVSITNENEPLPGIDPASTAGQWKNKQNKTTTTLIYLHKKYVLLLQLLYLILPFPFIFFSIIANYNNKHHYIYIYLLYHLLLDVNPISLCRCIKISIKGNIGVQIRESMNVPV